MSYFSSGIFKIEDSAHVARLWGLRKNRPAMNYDKLSRSIRQYYKKGIIRKPNVSQRLVYQFVHPVWGSGILGGININQQSKLSGCHALRTHENACTGQPNWYTFLLPLKQDETLYVHVRRRHHSIIVRALFSCCRIKHPSIHHKDKCTVFSFAWSASTFLFPLCVIF